VISGDGVPSGGNAAKKASAGKKSDEITSAHDATLKSASATGPSGMYSLNTVFKYTNKDRPPYIVQQPVDDADSSFLHPLHMSRLLSQIFPRDIIEIRKTG